jgi:hypothetical protein
VPVPSEPWEIRILPPEDPGDVLDEQPQDFGIDVSAILARMRREERY